MNFKFGFLSLEQKSKYEYLKKVPGVLQVTKMLS